MIKRVIAARGDLFKQSIGGSDGDLGWLASDDHQLIFGFEVGIEAGGDQRWHEEGLPHIGPAATKLFPFH